MLYGNKQLNYLVIIIIIIIAIIIIVKMQVVALK